MQKSSDPKYDNDLINLGYLKKLLKQQDNISKQIEELLPKSYSSPPSTPYNKGSLLVYNGKLFQCIKERFVGNFEWSDWKVIATDDTEIKNFIDNIYSTDKLQIQQQMDNKIESFYQENDPANSWTDDITKKTHVGDYWYKTPENTQWRYTEISTNPITYEWQPVDIPMSVYDQIDSKKSIYTSKPNSYKKDDMWIIEDNLDGLLLPEGVSKGNWVFATQDSDVFDKTHWVKKDENINIEYLEQHYYNSETLKTKFAELDRNVDSKINKSKDNIMLSVQETYQTKEETDTVLKDYDTKIGTLTETIEKQGGTIANLSVENGRIKESVESTTEKVTTIEDESQQLNSKIESVTNSVNQVISDTYTKTQIQEIVNGTSTDGVAVSVVKNASGTFDIDGMHYEASDSKIATTINNLGTTSTDDTGKVVNFSGYDPELKQSLTRSDNIHVTTYLTYGTQEPRGSWRTEVLNDFELGEGIGFFYIGGNQ